ncbi:dephospho-CoA kinase [Propionicimonas paludicola]|uniref:Dephospho-CoA kinase n=1 Tax=Propionicimonas paludicola TaxID=185243 RepID=A0A2A9CRY1_9ACTN|nr:dephospho-CoA kinase [Propionicimonas paludicola]PFG16951.1 dephospho-CoA kinase [Propionicimonas paludicola]
MSGRRVLHLGLTGGIASGKSTVAQRLVEHGALLIDADLLAREVVAPGTPGLAAVAARFGAGVLAADGSLDRPALGRVVFADPDARRDLEQIIHPAVRARAAELLASAPDGSVVVQMIPLLVETGQADTFDLVVVVDVPAQLQVQRLMARDGLSEAEAEARLAAQADRTQRLAAADAVIDNTGHPAELRDAVDRFWAAQVLPRLAERG